MKRETTTNQDNISFFLNEIETSETELANLEDVMNNIENLDIPMDKIIKNHTKNHDMVPYFVDYQMNYTVKQLLTICEYYGIIKICKMNKCNKEELIHHLMVFENDLENREMVLQRKNLWFYLNELKNDKFAKKFVLW
jgi:hypothetical protein